MYAKAENDVTLKNVKGHLFPHRQDFLFMLPEPGYFSFLALSQAVF